MKSLFITFEGPEGAGKTTIIKMIEQYFVNKEIPFLSTREPGGIRISESIREIILRPDHTEMDSRTEALLYAAARRQHLVEKVIPALKEGKVVLCDRFIDSSLAYQGVGRNLGIEEVRQINEFAIDGTMPDLTIFFDLDPSIGLKRVHDANGREINRLDLENIEFHKRVYEGYLQVVDSDRKRFCLVDASKSIEEVYSQVLQAIENKIN
ncbi:dTMP kinase [Bacillus sp. RG28]|uniref:Thymidylate kinase n=1 Tax=Gottfriedia endophytica TaxID=2820819 RepID=A0A940NTK0_9BACI|nr:dTMP kinase [Gottfriedia endophytica]MBP0727283.1 dTMP kinase [Gottfriedia endophytica]